MKRSRTIIYGLRIPDYISLNISHNEFNSYYETIEEYVKRPHFEDIDENIIEDCVKANSLWEIQLYPETPISFFYTIGKTFEDALLGMSKEWIVDENLMK